MGDEHSARNVLHLVVSAKSHLQEAIEKKEYTTQMWLLVCQDLSAAIYRAVCAWTDREK